MCRKSAPSTPSALPRPRGSPRLAAPSAPPSSARPRASGSPCSSPVPRVSLRSAFGRLVRSSACLG
eukprot:4018565-Heterocapsa_arctica.AAC.1